MPGAPAGWVDTVERFGSGKLTKRKSLAPAIELRRGGFPVRSLRHFLPCQQPAGAPGTVAQWTLFGGRSPSSPSGKPMAFLMDSSELAPRAARAIQSGYLRSLCVVIQAEHSSHPPMPDRRLRHVHAGGLSAGRWRACVQVRNIPTATAASRRLRWAPCAVSSRREGCVRVSYGCIASGIQCRYLAARSMSRGLRPFVRGAHAPCRPFVESGEAGS